MSDRRRGFFGVVLVATLVPAAAGAATRFEAGPDDRGRRVEATACAADKVSAAGEFMQALLVCATADRDDRDDRGSRRSCEQQATRQLTRRFAQAERLGACGEPGDAATVASRVGAQVASLVGSLSTGVPDACTDGRLRAMGRDADRQHECYAEAIARGPGFSVDAQCQDDATTRFLADYTRTARREVCAAGASDGPALDLRIRETVRQSRATVAPPITSCRPITPTALHGTQFLGNSRLSPIVGGQVACMNIDDGSIASCAFSTAAVGGSGDWLDSPQGPYALVGQAVSIDGTPGGDYVVAAAVSAAEPAACIEPTSMDTMGRVGDGNELAAVCVIEDLGSAYNALTAEWGWTPLLNYADTEVCMANDPARNPHPDNALLTRSYSSTGTGPADTFCYKNEGAALNDVNGAERDWLGQYFVGDGWCHYLVNGGYEVPAAKRPATRSLPAPGEVNTRSTIAWRPVNPNVRIANSANPGPDQPPRLYTDRDAFLAATAATSAAGPMPDLGAVGESVTLGPLTLTAFPSGNSMAVGAGGTPAAPDWMPLLPGNEIALGYENLGIQISTGSRVYALGFDFYEPNLTMPPYGGVPVDSTFEIVLYSFNREVGRLTFNAPDDQPTFIGVWSGTDFDRVTITDLSGNDDDEYFGEFFVGRLPRQ